MQQLYEMHDEMTAVRNTLSSLLPVRTLMDPHFMIAEVMWSAMRYLKDNPTASISAACKYGAEQWGVSSTVDAKS